MTANPQLRLKDPVIYSPMSSTGHYRGHVVGVRADQTVDIELNKDDTGPGDLMTLRCIPVVPTLADLGPATCTRDPAR